MLRYELESRGDMDGTDDSSNYHYCMFKNKFDYFLNQNVLKVLLNFVYNFNFQRRTYLDQL